MILLFFLQICDNRITSIGPSQDYRLAATLICRSHQSISLSDPARTQVFALSSNPPPWHQAGKSAGEQQLRTKDLRFWLGTRRRARHDKAHDAGSGHAILSCTGNPNGRTTLLSGGGRLVGWLHFRRAFGSSDSVPGSKSSSTGLLFNLYIKFKYFQKIGEE